MTLMARSKGVPLTHGHPQLTVLNYIPPSYINTASRPTYRHNKYHAT